jgi:hypothetical protein
LKKNRPIEILKMLITEVTSKEQTMLLRSFQEILETEIEMIKRSKLLYKTTLLSMKKERMKKMILRSIAYVTPPHPLT